MLCESFPPIARKDAIILILGSLPGTESLRKQQYYAKKANSFWPIMGELVGALPELSYPKRVQALLKKKIAVWDVCASAFRVGSLDTNIKPSSIIPNDFITFFASHKSIRLICFNGKLAEKLFLTRVLPHLMPSIHTIPKILLPSTSPAHAARPYKEKLKIWRKNFQLLMPN